MVKKHISYDTILKVLAGLMLLIIAFVIGIGFGSYQTKKDDKLLITTKDKKYDNLSDSYASLKERYDLLWDDHIELSAAYSGLTSDSTTKQSPQMTIMDRLENLETYVEFMHGEMDLFPIAGNEIKMDGGNEYFWLNRDTIINYGNSSGTKSRAVLCYWTSWDGLSFYDI